MAIAFGQLIASELARAFGEGSTQPLGVAGSLMERYGWLGSGISDSWSPGHASQAFGKLGSFSLPIFAALQLTMIDSVLEMPSVALPTSTDGEAWPINLLHFAPPLARANALLRIAFTVEGAIRS